jgi:hypothetical protein
VIEDATEAGTGGRDARADGADAGRSDHPTVDWQPRTGTTARARPPGLVAVLALFVAFAGICVLALGEGRFREGSPTPLDPTADGTGLVGPANSFAPLPDVILLWLLAVVVFALGWLVVRGGRLVRLVASIGALGFALAVVATATAQPLTLDPAHRTWGDGLGHTDGPTDSIWPQSTYAIGSDEAATFAFGLDNTGPLPISILGYAEEPVIGGLQAIDLGARIVGLASVPETRETPDVHDSVVAWPLRVDPGQRALITVVVRGGPCALGDADTTGAETATLINEVRIVYRMASWTRVATVKLPVLVAVPTREGPCVP